MISNKLQYTNHNLFTPLDGFYRGVADIIVILSNMSTYNEIILSNGAGNIQLQNYNTKTDIYFDLSMIID